MPKKKTTKPAPAENAAPSADGPAQPPAAQIVQALLETENGTTAAELSDRAGLARSTVTKALAVLLDHGAAVRREGGHEGARRIADRWFAAPASTLPPVAADAARAETRPDADAPSGDGEPATVDTSDTEVEPNGETTKDGDIGGSGAQAPALEGGFDSKHADVGPDTAQAMVSAAGPEDAASSSAVGERGPGEAGGAGESETVPVAPDEEDGAPRLGKGELRAMVEAHLRENPDRAWTPSAISKALNRSAGAINNAGVKLAETGSVLAFPDKPVRFQWNGGADADAS
jgi:DNA-binding transcriptional ArsR family regulator